MQLAALPNFRSLQPWRAVPSLLALSVLGSPAPSQHRVHGSNSSSAAGGPWRTRGQGHDGFATRCQETTDAAGAGEAGLCWHELRVGCGYPKNPSWAPNPNPPPASCSSRERGHSQCLAAAESSWNHIKSSRGGGEGESDLGLRVGKWEGEAGRAGADEK